MSTEVSKVYEEIRAPSTMEGSEGLIAIIIRAEYKSIEDGVKFFTPPTASLQLGMLSHPMGKEVPAHIHRVEKRTVEATQEVLIVRSGKVGLALFTSEGEPLGERLLWEGDVVLLVSGGHSLYVYEESDILEIKQGPYLGKDDKLPLFPRG